MADRILNVEVGSDLFHAQLIARAVQSAGLNVQLREMTPEGVVRGVAGQQHQLLVHETDLSSVMEIIRRSFPTN